MALTNVDVDYVLVPLDGSELALRAMPTARVLAERFGAELQTVSVAREDSADRLRALSSAVLRVDVGDDRVFVVTEGGRTTLLRDAQGNWSDVWCAFRPMAEGVCMER
jgi:nucleotide-binding universal stress UspA family protein